jgi:putative ATP-binding cassette transporter
MSPQTVHRGATLSRFLRAVRNLANSDVGWTAKLMMAAIIALLFAANALNVVNSYVGRNFMTSIADRNKQEFVRQAIFYIGVFAASTVAAVMIRFAEERLGLLWREFISRQALKSYLANDAYYRIETDGKLANPDQRIAEDVRAFTTTTLSFALMLLNSCFTVLAFSGVLWAINPLLFIVAVGYAAIGSFAILSFGRPLIKLNHDQLDYEAGFRSALIQVRESAESIKLARWENWQAGILLNRLDRLAANFRRIISINRNVGFFSTGYNWLIQIIPALIIAPAFINGEIEFGVVTQSSTAFAALVAAFSLIVTQFQSFSNFAAVVARLNSMIEAIEKAQGEHGANVATVEVAGPLAFDDVSLSASPNGPFVLKALTLAIPIDARVLVTGANQTARAALFRASAGLSSNSQGQVHRPSGTELLFLNQRPYLPRGSLREILTASADSKREGAIADARVRDLLTHLNLERLAENVRPDEDQDWGKSLSPREQLLLALARIVVAKPRLVFLDRIDAILGSEETNKILRFLSASAIGYINSAESASSSDLYDAVLECKEDGGWSWTAR